MRFCKEPLEPRLLLSGWTITGRVVDSEPGYVGPITSPLAGASVYADLNGNGVLDAGEPSATSGADGTYTLSASGAGTFNVREIPPPGGEHFASGESGARSVSIADGQSVSLSDFQDSQTATIGGTVFEDLNGNGVQDSGEPGLAGWAISVSQSDPDQPQAITDANGNWAITVRGGGYQVQFENPGTSGALSNWLLTTPVGGIYLVGVTGSNVSGLNFGVRPASPPGAPSADLVVRQGGFHAALPATPLGGQSGIASIRIENTGNALSTGPVEVQVYASRIDTSSDLPVVQLKAGDLSIADVQENVTLAPGGSRTVGVHFTVPADMTPGKYGLVAIVGLQQATPGAANIAGQDDLGLPRGTVFTVLPPTPDLAISLISTPLKLASRRHGLAVVRIENDGGVTAIGTASVELFASSDQALDSTDAALAEIDLPIRLRRGQSRRVLLKFSAAANLASGNYFLIASLLSSLTPPDASTANNVAISSNGTLFA